jgi:hypothetical protein
MMGSGFRGPSAVTDRTRTTHFAGAPSLEGAVLGQPGGRDTHESARDGTRVAHTDGVSRRLDLVVARVAGSRSRPPGSRWMVPHKAVVPSRILCVTGSQSARVHEAIEYPSPIRAIWRSWTARAIAAFDARLDVAFGALSAEQSGDAQRDLVSGDEMPL